MSMMMPKKKSTLRDNTMARMQREIENPISLHNVNFKIDADVFKKFKVKAAQNGTSMTELLTQYIYNYLD